MRKKLVALLAALLLVGVAAAQGDIPTLEYDTFIEGELTEEANQRTYTLAAEAGDTVLVEMRRGEDSSLFSTALTINGPNGRPVADTTDGRSSDVAAAVFVAEETADYEVIATRNEFSSSTGGYLLRALVLTPVEADEGVEGVVSNASYDQYHLLPNDLGMLNLRYAQQDGDYVLISRLNLVGRNGRLSALTSTSALPGVALTTTTETDEDFLYILSLGADTTDYEFSEVDSAYEVEVLTP